MMQEESLKKYSAILVILVIAVVVLWALKPFLNALLGGLIMSAVWVKPHEYLYNHLKLNRKLSSLLVILLSIFIVIIPLFSILGIVGNQIYGFVQDPSAIIASLESVNNLIPQIDLQSEIQEALPKIGGVMLGLISGFLANTGNVLFTLFIMYILVYYLLSTPVEKRRALIYSIVPFSKENSTRLLETFGAITNASLKTSGIIAVVQGGLMGLLFFILGISGALTLAFISAIMSFIPAVGVFVVWVPVAIISAAQGSYVDAIIVTAVGLIVSNLDNVLRPRLQSRGAGAMHPFTTLIGVFMGLSAFGLIGLIVGPLLLTFLFMTVKMFNEEYVT